MTAIASIYLDTRILKKDEIYPLKVKIYHKRVRKYFGLDAKKVNNLLKGSELEKFSFEGKGNFSIEKDAFEKAMGKSPRGIYRELREVFTKLEDEYQSKIDKINPFNFEALNNEPQRNISENDVFVMFEQKIIELENDERISSASIYNSTLKSLKRFEGRAKMTFEYLTVEKLKEYEKWMLKNGKKQSTTGIYLRTLRELVNDAIKAGITQNYPFGKKGLKIKKGSSRKIALNTEEIKLLFNHSLEPGHYFSFYFDMWKLSYVLNGINIKDMVLLREMNIHGDFIYFVREKTKNTVLEQTEIKIFLNEEALNIINKWKTGDRKGYILPVLSPNDKAKDITKKVGNLVRAINHAIKKIASQLGIEKDITCYTARHTFATQLMRQGAPTSYIGKQLGHTTTTTTDGYLASFEDETIREWQTKLTQF